MSGGSWTINMDEIELEGISTIRYITSTNKYEIDVGTARNKGFFMKFQGENKLVVPIKHWVIKQEK
jgi:hypothetical protein